MLRLPLSASAVTLSICSWVRPIRRASSTILSGLSSSPFISRCSLYSSTVSLSSSIPKPTVLLSASSPQLVLSPVFASSSRRLRSQKPRSCLFCCASGLSSSSSLICEKSCASGLSSSSSLICEKSCASGLSSSSSLILEKSSMSVLSLFISRRDAETQSFLGVWGYTPSFSHPLSAPLRLCESHFTGLPSTSL